MFINVYQKILETIRPWFDIARFPTGPVPVPIIRCGLVTQNIISE